MLLHSAPGSLRGGHSHDVDEVVVMLTGKMRYHKRYEDRSEAKLELKGGDSSFNRTGVHHMASFLEDSWLIEMKLNTQKGAWKNIDYQPWREQVQASG